VEWTPSSSAHRGPDPDSNPTPAELGAPVFTEPH
jgi:ribonuclease HI